MPLGIALGGAAIAGAATIGAGAMSSSAQKKAANKAADTSVQVADKNNALYRDIYGQNKALLTPYSDRGLLASNALTDLLLGTHLFNGQATPAGTPAPAASTTGNGALAGFQTTPGDTRTPVQGGALDMFGAAAGGPASRAVGMGGEPAGIPTMGPMSLGDRFQRRQIARQGVITPGTTPVPATPATPAPATGGTPAPSALSAWDQFRQGTNYQWRLNQGANVLNSKNAANGAFESGAADKAAIEYGQNFASNELSNYMNLLAGQQAMGLSAAGAVAGVGTSYAGNVAAQNTNAGNAAANAALVAGQGQANMWGSIGQGVGQIGGALFQYGMGQNQAPPATYSPSNIRVNPNALAGINWTGGF